MSDEEIEILEPDPMQFNEMFKALPRRQAEELREEWLTDELVRIATGPHHFIHGITG